MNKLKSLFKKSNVSQEVKTDIMRYSPNKISFWLCILAIVCNVAMFLIIYSNKGCVPGFTLGADLLVNVIVLLVMFLLAEKNKTYSKNGAIGSFVLGGFEVIRIFFIPLYYYNKHLEFLAAEDTSDVMEGLSGGGFTWCVILLVIAGISMVVAGLITYEKQKRLAAHIANLNK